MGGVLAAVKLSIARQIRPPGQRTDQVAPAIMNRCQGPEKIEGCLQGVSDAEDLKVVLSSQCAGATDEHPPRDAAVG
jgi:hypothetical protein